MSLITSIDQKAIASGCIDSFVRCIVELWKRVYDFACALFAYLFGSDAVATSAKLPPSVTVIIADYLVDFEENTEHLYIRAKMGHHNSSLELSYRFKDLTRLLATFSYFLEAGPNPTLLKKIETLFLTKYLLNDVGTYNSANYLNMNALYYFEIDAYKSGSARADAFIKLYEMSPEEAKEAVQVWQRLREIECLKNALIAHSPKEDPGRTGKTNIPEQRLVSFSKDSLDWVTNKTRY